MINAYSDEVDNSVIPDAPGVMGIILTIAMRIWKKNDSTTAGLRPKAHQDKRSHQKFDYPEKSGCYSTSKQACPGSSGKP